MAYDLDDDKKKQRSGEDEPVSHDALEEVMEETDDEDEDDLPLVDAETDEKWE